MTPRRIELLSPAKNAEIGIEAINHGADAVYIGAPRFSARAAAGNSTSEIARLVDYAHKYDSRVYVALNTILKDEELLETERIIGEMYSIGVDALIVQDMGILELDIPPIALHASTQTDNRTVEKVRFLENVGFSQVVLARELSLAQIRHISENTNVPLEVFIHGALCVSYSGQCYLSHCLSGRSANRGACAQFCRLPYTLLDADGRILQKEKHLLSLKDMNRTDDLEALLDAGVSSLKIEGRLKEMSYVKNVTAWYRKKLDAILERRPEYIRASSGTTDFFFTPDPNKSFNRGFTSYLLDTKDSSPISSPDTPKSMGEYIGNVKQVSAKSITIAGIVRLNNGDGLCFFNESGVFEGFRVNRVEGNLIFPAEMPRIKAKTRLYRNYDQEFEKILARKSADRRIGVTLELSGSWDKLHLSIADETGISVFIDREWSGEEARTSQSENQRRQLSKLGDTPFRIAEIVLQDTDRYFIPASLLSDMRRQVVDLLLKTRKEAYRTEKRKTVAETYPFPQTKLTYLGNVYNAKARKFYIEHGVTAIDPAFETRIPDHVPLMFTRHCIRRELGHCLKEERADRWTAPLYLQYKNTRLRLEFDCRLCEMRIYKE